MSWLHKEKKPPTIHTVVCSDINGLVVGVIDVEGEQYERTAITLAKEAYKTITGYEGLVMAHIAGKEAECG